MIHLSTFNQLLPNNMCLEFNHLQYRYPANDLWNKTVKSITPENWIHSARNGSNCNNMTTIKAIILESHPR